MFPLWYPEFSSKNVHVRSIEETNLSANVNVFLSFFFFVFPAWLATSPGVLANVIWERLELEPGEYKRYGK